MREHPGPSRVWGMPGGCAPEGMRWEPMPSPGDACEGTAGDTLLLLHPGTRRISWKDAADTSDKYASI